MDGQSLLAERPIAAILLISSGIIFAVGGFLYAGRAIWKWPSAHTPEFLRWERGFIILALLVNVFGLVLLEDMLRASGEGLISRLALVTYLIGAVVVVVAELSYLHNRDWVYPQIMFHVLFVF